MFLIKSIELLDLVWYFLYVTCIQDVLVVHWPVRVVPYTQDILRRKYYGFDARTAGYAQWQAW